MDAARYYIALFIVVIIPGVYLIWFSIHPFVRFWRKVGAWRTLAIHSILWMALAYGMFLIRRPLLSIEYGTHFALLVPAVLLLFLALVIRVKQARRLSNKVLIGLPELAPDKYESTLITDGIYAHIRHPRYVELLVAFLAYALLTNYLTVYVIALLGVVWIVLLVRIEEKELRDRFGEAYARYSEQVPRFIPRRQRKI